MPKLRDAFRMLLEDSGLTDAAFSKRSKVKQPKTSLTSAARRLVELSKKNVILVCSWNGVVSWFLPNKNVPWLQFDKTVLPQKSMTRLAFDRKESVSPGQLINTSVWFPNHEFNRGAELFEEVRYAKHLGMALTLLWLP